MRLRASRKRDSAPAEPLISARQREPSKAFVPQVRRPTLITVHGISSWSWQNKGITLKEELLFSGGKAIRNSVSDDGKCAFGVSERWTFLDIVCIIRGKKPSGD